MKIPKKIHYCWFGHSPLPNTAKKCIASWKKYFPDYEIIEWNESNFNINYNKYTEEAYKNKKYAYVADVARLYVIYNNGGIYFDVDVEVIKPYDKILNNAAFFGLEKEKYLNTGLGFGAEKKCKIVKDLLDDYKNKEFVMSDGKLNLTPCPAINSQVFLKNGFSLKNEIQVINNIAIYPIEYFNPLEDATGKLNITKNTHSIHWYAKSWVPKRLLIRSKILKPFRKLIGVNNYIKIKKIIKIK
ncbi:MAG: glycosyltransferase [Mycoplasmatota bacterium]|nr:glycosyltransferase [Mycoplasmatota bacterium]